MFKLKRLGFLILQEVVAKQDTKEHLPLDTRKENNFIWQVLCEITMEYFLQERNTLYEV